ncbi:TolB amino-terminal domain-containing protein [Parasphingorhabdus marina DSM 22363]|uniref:TolB amino-terminal domain-containing protein n=1 Tax=Parasphingorhabdus marina DSM 22363 TaxID=1123272 RepID=A0A1N6D291_9SPHN|nr:TIR domain-containing protein [Parasphingorhabdus marina]SIN64940.1 TolB amino-terminal domain-containing protein [Parasphingorhabdus marina DSM 22363]
MPDNDFPDRARETTVFFSYSRTDQKEARAIINLLERAGFAVWWDGLLEGGERFANATEAALDRARAVVVLWSKTSVNSHWVHDESTRGRDSGRLVPLSLDGSEPPLGFGQFQCIDISRSRIDANDGEIEKMLRAVAALHDGGELPANHDLLAHPVPNRRNLLIGGGVAAMAAAGLTTWLIDPFSGSSPDNGVAVLPFENLSGDPEQNYFSDGLTSEIRTQLSRNKLLQVVGQTSSDEFRGHQGGAEEIADKLGVTFLLDGNVQKAGDRVKITADLSDGRTGASRWSQSFERPLTDIFEVQSEIAVAVATSLAAVMDDGPAIDRTTQVGGTNSIAAFDAYLRGKELYEAAIDEQSDREALAKFDEALAIDPEYASAAAARSRTLAVIGNLYADFEERVRLYDEAVLAARKATELVPDLAAGHSALGFALASGKLDMKAARVPYERTYALGIGDADQLSRYATFKSRLRDYPAASAAISRASKLDPLNSRAFRAMGDIHYFGQKYELAMSAYRRAIGLNPDIGNYYSLLGFAQLMLGQLDAADESFSNKMSKVRRLPGYAIIAHKRNDRSGAEAALAELQAEYGDKSHYQYAQVYAQWGDTTRSLAALDAAWQLRDAGLTALYADPLLAPVREEPEYIKLVKTMGFI